MKKLIRSHFLAKHHISHTTTFEGLVTLQIENGDITLKAHRETCPRNATYESYSTIVELLASIRKTLENSLLDSLKGSVYYSIMVDESTDVASKEKHAEVKRVLNPLLTIWKAFYYSPKKAEKLKEIQAELQCPEVKMQKPSDTR